MHQRGFTLIEAVVSISLFSLMILGATLQLRAYEDGQRSIADALVLVKTARTFMTELSQVERTNNKFSTIAGASGIERVGPSILDDFRNATVYYSASNSKPGYDLLVEAVGGTGYPRNSTNLGAITEKFRQRWVDDSEERDRLFRAIGRRAEAWRVEVLATPNASGAYRLIRLHLDKDNNETNLQWPICCGD